jgi:hypothetical protein
MPVLNPNQPNQPDQPTQAPGSPERRQRGTGFTNIQRLLQANVGAGGVMGSAIGSGMTQKAGQLREDVTAAGQKFQQQYEKEREKALGQTGAVGSVANILSGQGDLSSLTPEEAERIGKQMREAQYGGQMGLENQEALMSRAGNVQALGTLAGMGSVGQGRLLQGIATRRGAYGRGQGLLDQYLVGQDVGAQQAIRQGAAETAGAASQALTGASVAEQQAQGLKQSIEAQKAETQRNVLSQLAGRQQEASQSARDFLSQAERIKNIIAEDIKEEDMTMEDRMAMSNLAQYGIDPAMLTTVDANTVESILKNIASSGQVEYTGQQRFLTDAQKKAAQNLALLAGDTEVAKKIEAAKFEPEVFKDANQTIKAQTKLSEDATNVLINKTGLTDKDQAKQAADKYNAGMQQFTGGQRGDEWIQGDESGMSWLVGDRDYQGDFEKTLRGERASSPNSFIAKARELLGPQAVWDIYSRGGLGGKTQYRRNVTMDRIREAYEQKLNDINTLNNRFQSQTSLQDYFNTRFGIKPQQGS